jgi:hypothetical protein
MNVVAASQTSHAVLLLTDPSLYLVGADNGSGNDSKPGSDAGLNSLCMLEAR